MNDYVPPCLRDREDVLARYGDKLRSSRQPGHPPVKTRIVWLKGYRVLQVRYGPSATFQNILGLEGVGHPAHSAEMSMLLKSFTDVLPEEPDQSQPPTDALASLDPILVSGKNAEHYAGQVELDPPDNAQVAEDAVDVTVEHMEEAVQNTDYLFPSYIHIISNRHLHKLNYFHNR